MELQQRRFPRLKDYDYSQPGAYYVTICIQDRRKMFGDVVNDVMCLNAVGEIAQAAWNSLPERFPTIELDAYVFMPNHFHGIVIIKGTMPVQADHQRHTLGDIIGVFKGYTSYQVHKQGTKEFRWQQKFWDSIVRTEKHLDFVRQYIANNPAQWTLDELYL